jgi:hypothetical protein
MGKFIMCLTTKRGNTLIYNTWPDFATKPRNVTLSLAIDGVNPFGEGVNGLDILQPIGRRQFFKKPY